MKRLLTTLSLGLIFQFLSHSQGENNIWTFGFEANTMINFNTSTPSIGNLPITPMGANTSHWASAVCYPNGQLRFFARLKNNFFPSTPEYYLFDATGTPITGSDLATDAGALDFSMPVIIPRPGNADQYYIFHCKDDGLFYSLLDMSLNGGAGAVVASEKNIPLTSAGSIYTRLITGVKGCDGTWVVVRSQIANEYYSFHVTSFGVDTEEIISSIGGFPVADYAWGGFLKASPDGSMLATTNWAGVEWYDFEQCSGMVTNARILDTTGNPAFYPGAAFFLPTHSRFTGVCFSPDNSKLYVTRNQFLNYEVTAGQLFQFDLSLSLTSAVIASKTLVMTNLPLLTADISGICGTLIVQEPLGEIKAGPDERLYINNGSDMCIDTLVPPGFNPCPGFHVLDNPNLTGMACAPSFNRIKSPGSASFNSSGYAECHLQNEIVVPWIKPDTVSGQVFHLKACFTDSLVLFADTNGHCPKWDNGSADRVRTVYQSGKYSVSYFKYCSFTTDAYEVAFSPIPKLAVVSQSCENTATGTFRIEGGHSIHFRAIWKNEGGQILQDHQCSNSDVINNIPAGNYSITYSTEIGCDTILNAQVGNYPGINVAALPGDTTIKFGENVVLHASGAMVYTWWPSGPLDTATKADPIARPKEPTIFHVLGIDENGCRDTAEVKVNIDYNMPDMIPNAFSPNGDGLNDVFRIEGITYQKVLAFKIFNRYGQLVFSTLDAQKGWDGSQNGKPCDAGTYYYMIQLAYPDGRQKSWKGDVNLIR